MIFRATRKVSSRLRIVCAPSVESRSRMMEWYCNLITVRRRPLFLFTHAPSLFSFWMPAIATRRENFGQVFRRHATDVLRDYGLSDADIAMLMDDGPDAFGKAIDRGVMGSMVDYAMMLRHVLDDEGGLERLGPRAMNDIANQSPMRKIGMECPARYLSRILSAERPHADRPGTDGAAPDW